ncbi:MAG TPA: FHA domain-containing protein [Kofleriaceae bacterium]|nr:FHA domain-containing protein [Kofleriaceae bacterium]
MGLLLDSRGGRAVTLTSRVLLGRSAVCSVVIEDPRVSAEHAVITWSGQCWEVRDLGSRNGTSLDGARLAPGARTPVRRDARLSLGGGEPWILADDRPLDAEPRGALVETAEADPPPALAELGLRFTPSLDEEHVDVRMCTPDGKQTALPARSCHYTLLTLARARLRDANDGIAAGEQGWLHAADLARMLQFTAERLNLEIFRARALFAKLGVADAPDLIERRPASRQLRIGVHRLQITRGA